MEAFEDQGWLKIIKLNTSKQNQCSYLNSISLVQFVPWLFCSNSMEGGSIEISMVSVDC